MWWLPCAIKKAGLLVLDASVMSPLKVLFSRGLAEFYLPHTAKSVTHCVVRQDAAIMFRVIMFKIRLVRLRSRHHTPQPLQWQRLAGRRRRASRACLFPWRWILRQRVRQRRHGQGRQSVTREHYFYVDEYLFCGEFSKKLNLKPAIEHDKHVFSAKSGEID